MNDGVRDGVGDGVGNAVMAGESVYLQRAADRGDCSDVIEQLLLAGMYRPASDSGTHS